MAVVLVTGAAGTLGNALVPRLSDRGHDVRVLLHHRSADFPPGVEVARGDVRNPDDLAGAVADVDAVIHAPDSPAPLSPGRVSSAITIDVGIRTSPSGDGKQPDLSTAPNHLLCACPCH